MTHENLREDDTSLQSSPPCLISLSTSSISSFTAIAAKRGGSFRTGTMPSIHLLAKSLHSLPDQSVCFKTGNRHLSPSTINQISPFHHPPDIPLPLSTGYPTSGPHNVTPNTHHNHVPCDLPPGIPKRDLVLAILSSSSSSVSVIVKLGPRYLHVSAVCQLQQLTSHIHQSINQSINQPCSELPGQQCSNPRYAKPSCKTIRVHRLQVSDQTTLLEFDFDEMPPHTTRPCHQQRLSQICHAEPCPTRNAAS